MGSDKVCIDTAWIRSYTHLDMLKMTRILEGGTLLFCKFGLLHILTILSAFTSLAWRLKLGYCYNNIYNHEVDWKY